jgi:hypothetical protein
MNRLQLLKRRAKVLKAVSTILDREITKCAQIERQMVVMENKAVRRIVGR